MLRIEVEPKEGERAVVLCSGGLDSLVILKYAINKFGVDNVFCLDIYYGQNHDIEMACSKRIAEYFGVRRDVIDISEVFKFSNSAMLKWGKSVSHTSYEDQVKETKGERCVDTYCPNRNAILINIAGAYALAVNAKYVFIGAHADDSEGFAYKDCREEFLKAEAEALEEGTDPVVYLVAPLLGRSKKDNIRFGIEQGLTEDEFAMSFSCYDPIHVGGDGYKQCETCGACHGRIEALEANSLNPKTETIYKR